MIEYRNEYCHAYSLRIGSLTELIQLKHNRYVILVIGFDHPCLCVQVCMCACNTHFHPIERWRLVTPPFHDRDHTYVPPWRRCYIPTTPPAYPFLFNGLPGVDPGFHLAASSPPSLNYSWRQSWEILLAAERAGCGRRGQGVRGGWWAGEGIRGEALQARGGSILDF